MSLDVYLEKLMPTQVFSGNVTHNLNKMADEAGIYKPLWRPEEIGITQAGQLVPLLKTGPGVLRSDPDRFKKLNPENGWGSYEGFVEFVEEYLQACIKHPDAIVSAWR